nr:hypothetical protein CTI12_AA402100 [Tanacetum cinerariifolium]
MFIVLVQIIFRDFKFSNILLEKNQNAKLSDFGFATLGPSEGPCMVKYQVYMDIVSIGARSLRVSKPKKHETLESTWKKITDGRHIPLNRHLKKSDTFENRNQHEPKLDYNVMKKLETFNDHTDRVLVSRKLRKEGSPSRDELNRRVEAFIKKFYDDLRLQRQESLQQYMDMINRGAE